MINISGHVKVYFKFVKELDLNKYLKAFLKEISSVEGVYRFHCGTYIFNRGLISIFQMPVRENNRVSMVLWYTNVSDINFINSLFIVSTKHNPYCYISCTVKGDINFDKLRRRVKDYSLKWLGETKKSFSAVLNLGGQIIWFIAYPQKNVFNIKGKFLSTGLKPSEIINFLYKGEKLKVFSVRVPKSISYSYTLIANKLNVTVSALIREALKRYLIELYSNDIEEVLKLKYE